MGPEIAQAIRQSAALQPDVLLVTRGGGSLEDLWGFNEEIVARAIAGSTVPVVSAVGHEIDVTIADLVADRRALTPTEAGELLVPNEQEWRQQLGATEQHLRRLLRTRYDRAHEQLRVLAQSRVLRDPYLPLREQERLLDELQQRAARAMRHGWERGHAELARQAAQLQTLSPLNVLSRGYSLTQRTDGKVVKQTSDVAVGEQVQIRVVDGSIHAQVIESGDPDALN